jgi:hypothetical protein
MRLIYLLASDADDGAATEIEALLKQRGYMVRRADEKLAYPPARFQEITLALWSKSVQFSPKQILFTNRAIDAWTEGRLIFAQLDHSLLPRGLGDVETIDLTFAPACTAGVWKIVEAAQEIDRAMETRRRESGLDLDARDDLPAEPAEMEPRKSRTRSWRSGGGYAFSAGAAVSVGLVAAAAFGSLGYLTLPSASNILLVCAALAWGAVAGAAGGYLGGRDVRAPEQAGAVREAPAPPELVSAEHAGEDDLFVETPAQVFVSYARSNGEVVYPMVAEVEAAGREVWIDRDELPAGGNWAGMIVRAIRDSDTFCLMCSAEAFQSDNVRREIYIADKYKRKLLPVRLDFAQMPEDFEYFLIDRQWLDLTAVEPGERALRLKAALVR